MKPGARDHRHRLLIGDELRELKRHTGSMAEAFGLDRKIDNYKGTRPLGCFEAALPISLRSSHFCYAWVAAKNRLRSHCMD
jgi:hypothetical protein